MLSLAFALFTAAAIAFTFKSTRPMGIVCVALFIYAFPLASLGLMATGAAGYVIYRVYFKP